MFTQDRRRGQGFHGCRVAGAGHHQVGLRPLIVARPIPNAGAFGAMPDGSLHVEILQMRLLIGNDHIEVARAAQAVIRDAQQTIRVRRQVDAGDFRALIRHQVQEAGILVSEAVMVLAPNRRSD